jgi:nitrogen fixation NifU-like protein
MTDAPYNELVLDCFNHPRHWGQGAEPAQARQVSAQAAEFPGGPRVRLSCDLAEGRLTRVAFSGWGCPHFLAAAELLCRRLEGLDIDGLADLDLAGLVSQLAVPVEKTGRILTLEDAFSGLKREVRNTDSLKS